MIQNDSIHSWLRACQLFLLGVIGTVGMWSVVVFIPEIENEFKVDRGTSSFCMPQQCLVLVLEQL